MEDRTSVLRSKSHLAKATRITHGTHLQEVPTALEPVHLRAGIAARCNVDLSIRLTRGLSTHGPVGWDGDRLSMWTEFVDSFWSIWILGRAKITH